MESSQEAAAAGTQKRRVPVRAAVAYAGGGSLGTFLMGATREIVGKIWQHNRAVLDNAPAHDRRYMHPDWGHVTIDALSGASAGALCSCQLLKGLFEPEYLDPSRPIDEPGTATADWVHGADFLNLVGAGSTGAVSGSVEAAGWTVLSGARMQEVALRAIRHRKPVAEREAASPLDPTGVVAIGIALTDVLGYHEPAEFAAERVLGHPDFGCAPLRQRTKKGKLSVVRDLGGRGHGEIRKLFVGMTAEGDALAREFLRRTRRHGRARSMRWSQEASQLLAGLAPASASLPLGLGPVALTDRAADLEMTYRRLYVDGGVMNNKPVSPALQLARWHDLMRLFARQQQRGGEILAEDVEAELGYERVCFFVDAFPDAVLQHSSALHPDSLYTETGSWQASSESYETLQQRIDESLRHMGVGLGAFATTMLSGLRAKDMQAMARTNERLEARNAWIDRLCNNLPYPDPTFSLRDIEHALAYASVILRPAGRRLTMEQRMTVAARIFEADQISELAGRRQVTIVPIFAPANLRAVFAGGGLYSMAGLMDEKSRCHDAKIGAMVAKQVLKGLRSPGASQPPVHLPEAPPEALPESFEQLVDRMGVLSSAASDRNGNPVLTLRAFGGGVRRGPLRKKLLRTLWHLGRGGR